MFLSAVKGVLLTLKNCNTSHRHIWDTNTNNTVTALKKLISLILLNDMKEGQKNNYLFLTVLLNILYIFLDDDVWNMLFAKIIS